MRPNLKSVLCCGALTPLALAAQERPNIIYIMTDQQSANAMSCTGNVDVRTPNMDRLAAHGVRFENAYCSLPLSGPSRASMFTGYMPGEVGLTANGTPLPDSLRTETLGNVMNEGGYTCAYGGKWHVHTNSLPSEHALQRKHEKPFFLVASFDNPHNICEYARKQPLPFAVVEEPESIEDCPNLPENFFVSPYDADAVAYEKSLKYRLHPTRSYTPDDWRRYRNAYFRLVEAVDAEIGKIVDEIDRQNLWKNTVVIFTSDHGDGQGAHQWNQKSVLYEEVVNVPFIVCLPEGKNAGKILPQLVNNGVDLMPSVCDWAGIEVPSGRQGISIRPIAEKGDTSVEGQPYVVAETDFSETGGGTMGWMVRSGNYKYVLYNMGLYREQLFDMTSDRGEMRNLAVEKKYRPVLEQHRRMLEEWMKKHPVKGKVPYLRYIPNGNN